ncbi:LOW QUALITY PROTEIN: nuclear factor NF-kappa-B p105 subunit [Xiphophorus couchianus]|uniref:LOW QUALITY PROTEIN: nuclear factor NF-kappa-B p105 subunit n=1 Tax=Xiphophorus couchianus TaxID=32473 RepID=UPI0010161B18|nr:LOW QUALITY PROTEIN: nuclear factor NF-kappa-B p105 subunit [Xiphophorus couchianus]
MAADENYLHPSSQIFDTMMDPSFLEYSPFVPMPQMTALQSVDGPFLQILEQPKQRGFRFRYGCEGPSHGGLPGASSEKNRKTYPTVKICNYQGQARVVVQLVTALTQLPQLHAHSLVGKQCDKGICIADLQSKDSTISFPNLGILHVTKKNVAKTLEERMVEAFRMGYNCGVAIHPEIDALQGEVRVPRELSDHQRSMIISAAAAQAKEMDLSVVRLMFTAFLPDSDGGFSRRLEPVVSEPIYDSKAPNASNLKIVRMDRTAGCVTGGEEVYLLCDKVQKDDIQVRFYEEDDSGLTWEALGDFSPTDVHRQFAIVFKTPKYRDQNLQKPTSVFVQLKRKSDNETSEPKPFTYHPQIIDKEEVQRKRQKTLPNFQDFSGHGGGGGGGGLYRGGGGGGGPASGVGGPGSAGGGYYQGFSSYSYGGAGGGFSSAYSAGLGGGGGTKHALQSEAAEDSGDDSDPDNDPASGAVLRGSAQSDGSDVDPDEALMEATCRQLDALFRYSVTGDSAYLLAPQRPLMAHRTTTETLGCIWRCCTASRRLTSLTQVVSTLTGEELLNMRNHLYQTPLHLAVITRQKQAAEVLLLAGADPTLTDRHGNTVLHLAAQQEGDGMVELLLRRREMRELLQFSNTAGLCAIHLAVLANRLAALRELLVGGADVEAQEHSGGRTALHLATETDNVSLAGCLLLEGNAKVDSCTFNGSTPLHVAAGRGSVKLTALLMAAGADPHRENFEPIFIRDEEEEEEDEDDEGYISGTTPVNMATCPEVLDLLNGQEYEPRSQRAFVPPQGDLSVLDVQVKRAVCGALEAEGCWENLAHHLGLGILNTAFRLSPNPARTLLESYEVSGGTVSDLLAALRSAGGCRALSILEGALRQNQDTAEEVQNPLVQNLKRTLGTTAASATAGWSSPRCSALIGQHPHPPLHHSKILFYFKELLTQLDRAGLDRTGPLNSDLY